MNTSLLLTYHAWTKPRQTLYQLGEQVGFHSAIVLYAVITLLSTGIDAFIYPEPIFEVLFSLILGVAAPLVLSELAHHLTKYGRRPLLHGILLIYTSSDLLLALPYFVYTLYGNVFLTFNLLLLLISLWSFAVLIFMLSELIKRHNSVAFLLQLSVNLTLLLGRHLFQSLLS